MLHRPERSPARAGFRLARFAFALAVLINAVPAEAQLVAGLGGLERIATERFDIYYIPELRQEALRLRSFADDTLERLEALLGFSLEETRFPVFLASGFTGLNGYSTVFPSSRIALTLDVARPKGALASMEDELASVFLHELVHAVTLNLRSPFWSLGRTVFGDQVAPVAWTAPSAIVEGTAVWAESLNGDGTGRLNDPASLEPVFLDLEASGGRELIQVSGLLDYPGAGALPYLYGGLFVDYLARRFGTEIIGDLWRELAKGAPSSGLEGAPGLKGGLERVTGTPPSALWRAFLDSLAGESAEPAGAGLASLELSEAGNSVGALAFGGGRLFYQDLDSGAVYAISVDGAETGRKQRLFETDSLIEAMRASEDGRTIDIDWFRYGLDGVPRPASYRWDSADGRLKFAGERELPQPGEAVRNLYPDEPVFLWYGDAGASGYRYGLVRLGSRVFPTRESSAQREQGKAMEILDSPFMFPRDLDASVSPGGGGFAAVLSGQAAPGIGTLALLREDAGTWRMWVLREPPPGGVHSARLLGGGRIAYRSVSSTGKSEAHIALANDEALAASFDVYDVEWMSLEAMRGRLADARTAAAAGEREAETEERDAARALFPRALESARFPVFDGETLGLRVEGEDLSERLSWSALLGWNVPLASTAAELGARLGTRVWDASIALQDKPLSDVERLSAAVVDLGARLTGFPAHRLGYAGLWSSAAGIRPEGTGFAPEPFSYLSLGAGARLGFSDLRSARLAPFDPRGFELAAGADYEWIVDAPGGADEARGGGASTWFSIRGETGAPSFGISLAGAVAIGEGVLFGPAYRSIEVGTDRYRSALALPYPVYREYSGRPPESPWYLTGELRARMFSLELAESLPPLRMPLLPAVSLRRIVARAGMRAALYLGSSATQVPASAFMRLEADFALHSGLAAQAHIDAAVEATCAVSPLLPGESRFGVTASLDYRL